MVALRTAFATLILCAVAGAAAAQQGQGSGLNPAQINAESQANAAIQNYRPEPSSFIDNPPAFGAGVGRGCHEGRAKDAKPPRVVKTMPAPGSTVRPGQMVLSVTFDQPMACKANTASGSPFPIPCPADKAAVVVAPDQRTLTTVCTVEPGARYSMPIDGFISAQGARAERYDLVFDTSADAPVADARKALMMEKAGPVRR